MFAFLCVRRFGKGLYHCVNILTFFSIGGAMEEWQGITYGFTLLKSRAGQDHILSLVSLLTVKKARKTDFAKFRRPIGLTKGEGLTTDLLRQGIGLDRSPMKRLQLKKKNHNKPVLQQEYQNLSSIIQPVPEDPRLKEEEEQH